MRWLPDGALDHLKEVASEPDLAGTPYEIAGTIGQGGMGTVYLARDRDLDREVALKVVQLHQEDTERMLREARILARLEHPGIVPVHDVGVLPDGRAWYVMKRVRGSRLDEHARSLSLPDRLRAFERICEAVAFAHAHGVIHRDLKPENVMVGPFGEVLVMDWGVAKLGPHPPAPSPASPTPSPGEGETEKAGKAGGGRGRPSPGEGDGEAGEGSGVRAPTLHGTILGTPGYMAPEQERGEVERIDERADVYALGAILSFLLEGEDRIPRPLQAIRSRAMAAEPEGRYPSVRELSADLGRYLDGLPVAAYRESLIEQAARLFRRYRAPILIVLAYLLMRALLILILGR
ncbi:MAG TPA: serine/threonine-protein kinase [Thermoanaerobaculia bacterium]|nr:serine/threonine-protein kinase [Thermoanaerobaculia bacterium]